MISSGCPNAASDAVCRAADTALAMLAAVPSVRTQVI